MSYKIELVEEIEDLNTKYLDSPIVDGENAKMLRDFLDENVGEDVAINVFRNAYQGLRHFVNPRFNYSDNCLSKDTRFRKSSKWQNILFYLKHCLSF